MRIFSGFRGPGSPPWRRVLSFCFVSAVRVSARNHRALGVITGLVLAGSVWAARVEACSLADSLAVRVAACLSDALKPLAPGEPTPVASLETQPFEEQVTVSREPAGRSSGAKRSKATVPRSRAPGHAVFVTSAQVLALAARRTIPQAVPVPATTAHPAGLKLLGVSALGVGLRDGDVLTDAAGLKASSVGAVIGAVIAARARLSPVISGRFFRAGEPYSLTVEQPYEPSAIPG